MTTFIQEESRKMILRTQRSLFGPEEGDEGTRAKGHWEEKRQSEA